MRLRRKDVVRRLKFSAAILVAALASDVTKADTWRQALNAFRVFFHFRPTMRTPRLVYYERMRACRQCVLYEPILGTCGSAWRKDLKTVGCRCCMLFAATELDKGCYLNEELDDYTTGWPASASRFSGFETETDDPVNPSDRAVPNGCRGCGKSGQPG